MSGRVGWHEELQLRERQPATQREAGPSTDEMIRRYRAGETLVEVGAAMGVSGTTVERRLKRAGVVLRPAGWRPGRRRPDVEDEDLVARYAAGESLGAIGAATGLHPTAVHYRLRRAGVEMRSVAEARQYARLDLPIAEIIERYRAGDPIAAIGRSLGISHHVIRERLIEAGIKRRTGRRRGATKGAG
jgi:DNA-binding Lrp family transcriptional regulator